eukprot:symbB.v1.2.010704.t1/scaffold676.1/size173388/11
MSRRGIQEQSQAWAKLYDKKDKEAFQVANPKETLRKMYDKLVTPKLLRHGANVPLPFEDEKQNSKEEMTKKAKEVKKAKGKSALKKEKNRSKKKKKKSKKVTSSSTSGSTSSSSSSTSTSKSKSKIYNMNID